MIFETAEVGAEQHLLGAVAAGEAQRAGAYGAEVGAVAREAAAEAAAVEALPEGKAVSLFTCIHTLYGKFCNFSVTF